jgi:hypothetical protein
MLKLEPLVMKFRMLMALPNRPNALVDTDDPKSTKSRTDCALPRRANVLKLIELEVCTCPKIDIAH